MSDFNYSTINNCERISVSIPRNIMVVLKKLKIQRVEILHFFLALLLNLSIVPSAQIILGPYTAVFLFRSQFPCIVSEGPSLLTLLKAALPPPYHYSFILLYFFQSLYNYLKPSSLNYTFIIYFPRHPVTKNVS